MAGETGPIADTVSLSISMVIAGLFAISVYNSLEIYISIYRTFRRRQGLYFWSAICANTGIPILSVSSLLRFFALAPAGPMSIVIDIGWWMMVTGQSLMVYSRLHLVIGDPRKLRWLLCMVIGMFLFVQVPVGILFIANNYYRGPNMETPITTVFDGTEKTQLVVLSLQEVILSGLYVYEWANMRKQIEITKGRKVQTMFHELVTLFVVVVALDISLIIIQFANLFEIQVTYKPLVYSIKLKVETFVLNNLVELVSSGGNGPELPRGLMTMDRAVHDDDPWRSRRTPSLGARGGNDSELPVPKKTVSI
ncbi:hypothetical protein E0Z10_g4084 [Xylaria hypoxylon]|uniref:DUF7703 domain-containing protein n=1 Tax=Xylaria hypoxylon TaxID=37992 RepID=A0A4Z0Z5D0_9PEZI|nr:hypothetical protein E0Z10_g4084 [Xylaria hypoxylon]